jgi:hypothetical protein
MLTPRLWAALALVTLSACAAPGTQVLPPYQLANGQTMQDVVTVAADPSGGAPVITALTTYDVGRRGTTRVIARESASAPGPGQLIAAGAGQAVIAGATVLAVDAITDGDGTEVTGGSGTTVNATFNTSGNSATDGGDAGDIDGQVVVCPRADPDSCTPSN